ncbi:phage tail protein, partial [Morganella morganii]
MIEIFTWCPRVNPTEDITYKTRRAKFGDGYEQVSGDGLNPRSQKWSLEFTG